MRAKNKAQVIHVAARLFLDKGYRYTSMDEIMEESKVSKSNIYYHFDTKEELLLAVVDFMASRYESALQISLSRRQDTAEARIRAFITLLTMDISARELKGACPFMSLYMQSPNEATAVKERILRFFAELQPLVAELLEQGMKRGELRPDFSPVDGAQLFISALEGSLVLSEMKRDIAIVDSTISRYFDLIRIY